MNANIVEKANRVIQNATEASIALIDEQGFPTVSTVSSIRTEGVFRAWFVTGLSESKTKRIQADPRAGVCYRDGEANVTLVGLASILTDAAIRHELWRDGFQQHFPAGRDDPNYCVIAFETKRASLWAEGESAAFFIADLLRVQSRCGLLCSGCSFREPCGCGGCVAANGHPFYGECTVARCCQEKGLMHCGECDRMPCEKLYAFSCTDPEHGDKPAGARLAILRAWKRENRR